MLWECVQKLISQEISKLSNLGGIDRQIDRQINEEKKHIKSRFLVIISSTWFMTFQLALKTDRTARRRDNPMYSNLWTSAS